MWKSVDPAAQEAASRHSRMAFLVHAFRNEQKRCRATATAYAPAIVLPALTFFCSMDVSPSQALWFGWLNLGLFAVGLFIIFMREADADHALRRLARLRRERQRRRRGRATSTAR